MCWIISVEILLGTIHGIWLSCGEGVKAALEGHGVLTHLALRLSAVLDERNWSCVSIRLAKVGRDANEMFRGFARDDIGQVDDVGRVDGSEIVIAAIGADEVFAEQFGKDPTDPPAMQRVNNEQISHAVGRRDVRNESSELKHSQNAVVQPRSDHIC